MAGKKDLDVQRRRRTAQTHEKRRRVLAMFRDGANGGEIARVMGLSRQYVNQLLNEELRMLADERRNLASEVFDLELERLANVIRNCTAIMAAPCRECEGMGAGPEPIPGTTGLSERCVSCAGTGRMYVADVRLRAMRELRMSIDQRAKMLGLYAPEKFALTDSKGHDLDFTDELKAISGDELSKAVDDFQAGLEAAKSMTG